MQGPSREPSPAAATTRPRTSTEGGRESSRLLQLPPPVPPLPAKSPRRSTPTGSDSGYGGSQPTSARILPPVNGDASSVNIGGGTPDSVPPRDVNPSPSAFEPKNTRLITTAAATLPENNSTETTSPDRSAAVPPTRTPVASDAAVSASTSGVLPSSHETPSGNSTAAVASVPSVSVFAVSSTPVLSPTLPTSTTSSSVFVPNLPPPPSSPSRSSTPRNQRIAHNRLSGTPAATTSSLRLRLGATDSLPPLLPNLPTLAPLTPPAHIVLSMSPSPSPETSSPGEGAAPYDGLPSQSGSHPLMSGGNPFQMSESGSGASSSHPRTRSATTMMASNTSGSVSRNGRPHSNTVSLMSGLASPRLIGGSTPGSYMVPMDAAPGTSTMPGGTTMKMTPSMVLRPTMTPQMKFPSLLLSGVSTGVGDDRKKNASGSVSASAAITVTPAAVEGVPVLGIESNAGGVSDCLVSRCVANL